MSSSPDYEAYTQSVIAAMGSQASPRVKQAFPILFKHLHAAIVEAEMTIEEWRESSGSCRPQQYWGRSDPHIFSQWLPVICWFRLVR